MPISFGANKINIFQRATSINVSVVLMKPRVWNKAG